MNAIIHDMDVELARGDTMINPKFRTAEGTIRQHDVVVANPMWNQPFAPDIFANDPFDRFRTTGGVTSGKGDRAWLQHTLACLNDHQREGAIARRVGGEALAAVEDAMVAIPYAARPDRGRGRTGIGFGQRESQDQLAGHHLRDADETIGHRRTTGRD